MRSREDMTSNVCPLDWRESRERDRHLREIEMRIASSLDAAPADTRRLTLVWSAGRAGFRRRSAEIDSELDHYRRCSLARSGARAGSARR
jgi:hypothetical protein